MLIATADMMGALDRRAVELGTPISVLMERAGRAVYRSLPLKGSVAVVCGKGNNGGDGYVVGRLALADGRKTCCFAVSEPASPAALDARQEYLAAGGAVSSDLSRLGEFDLVVDALLGTGARGAAGGEVAAAVDGMNTSGRRIVSIDVPSGIECDTGHALGAFVEADHVVTLGHAKPFLFQGVFSERGASWSVEEIGLPDLESPLGEYLSREWVAARLPKRTTESHKGANGHVLIVAGSHRMRGAATLAAQGALRAGAGLVTVAAVEEVCATVSAHLPECLLLPLPAVDGDAAKLVLEYQDRVDAGLFGPGLTTEEPVRGFLSNVFESWSRPALVDADALNAVAMGAPLPNVPCVMTPHPGEAKRLLDVDLDRFETVRGLAGRFGKCVLLKGRYSLVADADKPVLANSTGNAGLATGGSGDTLGGIIATLLAQGLEPRDAAACGMYLHGAAADHCVATIGRIGYTPSEVAAAVPWIRDRL